MQGFYVLLIILGIICVILSFMLAEKLDGKSVQGDFDISENVLKTFLEKNEENLDQAIISHVERTKEAALEETTKALNRLTNEKIMAVDEFSDSVLEKISQNHSEVIFLYNMLNEKERELKELVASVNQAANKSIAKNKKPQNAIEEQKQSHEEKRGPASKSSSKKAESASKNREIELTEQEKEKEAHTREEILGLYEQGLSVTDIAKKLKMGKGEIKLIIDLYQGARR
ncbi:MAG TPA: hypothetical protein DCW90_17320 [Lachnospiraceae bacterium]|nr:DUF6115 domain-containing protein [uncultured Lachnoclostridium sp.]HAU87175.1 hypothetical protein [Lachnospiraceae bacterium]